MEVSHIFTTNKVNNGIIILWLLEASKEHAKTNLFRFQTLQGHLGPVTCLSFDEWHLVTGSNDGYILGWSMLGNHKRCLGAFRHPM